MERRMQRMYMHQGENTVYTGKQRTTLVNRELGCPKTWSQFVGYKKWCAILPSFRAEKLQTWVLPPKVAPKLGKIRAPYFGASNSTPSFGAT